MIEDESIRQYPENSDIPHLRKENGINPSIPYYWSWYRLAFPVDDRTVGDPLVLPQQEKE